MKVLLTGGAGYVGSVVATALEEAGHVPVVLDSLLSGPRAFTTGRVFYEGDIADRALLRRIVREHPDLDATVHLAARIVVPESIEQPYAYYRDNVTGSLELVDELVALGRPRIVFSSSAALYAPVPGFEVRESDPLAPASPYAWTKLVVEQALADLARATDLRAVVLRYFNPVGSDPGLRSGVHLRAPTHVLGQLLRTVRGHQPAFVLTGTDHPTRDGTGLRDYVHVWDVARAHVRALERFDAVLERTGAPSTVINVGRGVGITVRELVAAVERVHGAPVPVVEAPARPGDAVGGYANVDRAGDLLGWRAEHDIDEAVASALAWEARRITVLGYP